MRKQWLAVSAMLVGSLAACTGEADGMSAGSGDRAVKLSAAQVMTKVSDRVGKANTYRIRMTSAGYFSSGGTRERVRRSLDMRVRLAPDFAMVGTERDQGSGPLRGTTRMVVLDGTWYANTGASAASGGKPWVKMPFRASDGDDPGDRAFIDGLREFALELSRSEDVHEVGRETIDGVRVTHYTGTVPMAGGDPWQVHLWIDGDDLPRKQVTRVKDEFGVVTDTCIFTEYGRPVTITAPPADQVGVDPLFSELPAN